MFINSDEVRKILFTGDAFRLKWDERLRTHIPQEFPIASMCRYFPRSSGFNYEDTSRLLYIYGYVFRYFKQNGVNHDEFEVDALTLKDIPFPSRFMSRADEIAHSLRDTPSQLVRNGMWYWSRKDRYASLVCYRYCVKYNLCPTDVLYFFRRIYARCASRKLGSYYEWLNNEAPSLEVAVNVDPFVFDNISSGDIDSSALSSYFGYDLDVVPDIEELKARCSDDVGWQEHFGRFTHLSDSLVKKKKLNDYKRYKRSPIRTFVPNY